MSSNTYIRDSLTRHQVYLGRYANKTTKELQAILRKSANEVSQIVVRGGVPSNDLFELTRIVGELTEYFSTIQTGKVVFENAKDLAEYESQYFEGLLTQAQSATVTTVAPETAVALVADTPMKLVATSGAVQELTIAQAVTKFNKNLSNDVTLIVQQGFLEGDSVKTISRNVKALGTGRSSREAEAMVRTVINHTGSTARESVARANTHIIKKERYTATLDSRTTMICMSLDGKLFDVGQGPQPPIHYQCRSLRSPVIDDSFGLSGLVGERPSKGDDGKNVVSGNTNYSTFLRRQSPEFQNDVLGETRAKLFRSGELTLDKFVDEVGGTIKLKDLRLKDGSMFSMGGIKTTPVVRRSSFRQASSIAEAQDVARKIGIKNVEYAGLTVGNANAINKSLGSEVALGGLKLDTIGNKMILSNAYMEASASRKFVHVSPKHVNSFELKTADSLSDKEKQYTTAISSLQKQYDSSTDKKLRRKIYSTIGDYEDSLAVITYEKSLGKKLLPHGAQNYAKNEEQAIEMLFRHETAHIRYGELSEKTKESITEIFHNPETEFFTEYSKSESEEYFAESFSLFRYGHTSKVDKKMLKILEDI